MSSFPAPEDHPNTEIKPTSIVSPALAAGFFTTAPLGKPHKCIYAHLNNAVLLYNTNFRFLHTLWELSWSRICLQWRWSQFNSWLGKIRWRRDRLPTPVVLGFPCGSPSKESACNSEDLALIPGLGRSPREGNAIHSSILAWSIPWTVQSMGKQSRTRLSDFQLIKLKITHYSNVDFFHTIDFKAHIRASCVFFVITA